MEEYSAGTLAGAGSFQCHDCGFSVALMALDAVPECPNCASTRFQRASIFARPKNGTARTDGEAPEWLDDLRDGLDEPGYYVAFSDEDRLTVIPLVKEWTRIGRSAAADIRLDDPTVSRRHALLVKQPNGVRILDDRSLNGVFVSGERVDWRELEDGDELIVGRFCLYFIDMAEAEIASGVGSDAQASLA